MKSAAQKQANALLVSFPETGLIDRIKHLREKYPATSLADGKDLVAAFQASLDKGTIKMNSFPTPAGRVAGERALVKIGGMTYAKRYKKEIAAMGATSKQVHETASSFVVKLDRCNLSVDLPWVETRPVEVRVNWSAIGASEPKVAAEFADTLAKMSALAIKIEQDIAAA